MKRFFTFVLTISLIISCMTFSVQAVSFADDYVFPAGLPTKYRSSIFTVSVDETPVGTYKAGLNVWGNEVACCAFSTATAVTITVTTDFAFSSARILPRSANISCSKSGNTLTFSITSPQNLTVLFDENFQGNVLHIFAQAPDSDIIDREDTNTIYFGPGYYDYASQSPLRVESGQTLYLAAGAVLRGRVLVSNASNVTICGRGIILNDFTTSDGYDSVALTLKNSSNVTIKDVTILRNSASWSAFMWKCGNVSVENVKILNPKYACSDGFDIANSHDVTFNNLFIRSCDDSIAIKGTGNHGYNVAENPAETQANYRISILNSQVWSDTNNALGIGAETVAAYYDEITFENIDILYNYDDYTYPDQFTERSALNICALNATNISNITYADIRVEKAKRLISVTMPNDFWFGSLQGNWNWNGSFSGITYRNIISYSNGSNEIQILGHDSTHTISDIQFDNIQINGQILDLSSPLFKTNKYTKQVKLCNNGIVLQTKDGPFGSNVHNAAEEYSAGMQGYKQWFYRTWTNGVGNADMLWNRDGSYHWRGVHAYDAIWMYDNTLYMHPDTDQTMLEWTASSAGTIQISGSVRKYDVAGGDGVSLSIWKNNTLIWPTAGWRTISYNDSIGLSHDFAVDVNCGDVISFRVDEGDNNAYDTTIWDANIVYNFYRSY